MISNFLFNCWKHIIMLCLIYRSWTLSYKFIAYFDMVSKNRMVICLKGWKYIWRQFKDKMQFTNCHWLSKYRVMVIFLQKQNKSWLCCMKSVACWQIFRWPKDLILWRQDSLCKPINHVTNKRFIISCQSCNLDLMPHTIMSLL